MRAAGSDLQVLLEARLQQLTTAKSLAPPLLFVSDSELARFQGNVNSYAATTRESAGLYQLAACNTLGSKQKWALPLVNRVLVPTALVELPSTIYHSTDAEKIEQ